MWAIQIAAYSASRIGICSYNLYTCGCDVFIARTCWTLAHMTSIPVGVMHLHARTFCTLSDTILYPLRVPIFTVITEVWPRANRAVVTNNLTMIIEVVLIKSFLCISRYFTGIYQIIGKFEEIWFPLFATQGTLNTDGLDTWWVVLANHTLFNHRWICSMKYKLL